MRRRRAPATRVARRHAGRLLLAAQPGRARVRGARRAPGRLRPARGRSAAARAVRRRPRAEERGPGRRPRRRRRLLRRRRASASTVRRRSRGRRPAGHDVAVCAIGPGHRRHRVARSATAGSPPRTPRTRRSALGGRAVIAARVSEADARERHRGLSHHTRAVLELCLGDVRRRRRGDGEGWREACAGPAALAHGPRPGRGSGVLRGGVSPPDVCARGAARVKPDESRTVYDGQAARRHARALGRPRARDRRAPGGGLRSSPSTARAYVDARPPAARGDRRRSCSRSRPGRAEPGRGSRSRPRGASSARRPA